jgi:hypothetical protein
MPGTTSSLQQLFLSECISRLDASAGRIFHCLHQLNEEQTWRKADERTNSVGMLVQHICGSFRQWTITVMNNEEDMRHRPGEFSDSSRLSKKQLVELVEKLKTDFVNAITGLDPSRLPELKRIQGYDITLLSAIMRALIHLEGHVGQIMLLTRIELGASYKIFWTPQTEEQKAERKN